MQLDQHFVTAVQYAILAAWNQIAWDVEDSCESNEQAVEMCLDADRLMINREDLGPYKAVKAASEIYGHDTVVKFLANHIQVL